MQRIAVINQKGGVGKTTTTVNFGAALVARGRRVLLLDMDPQANLTLHIDRQPDLEAKTLTHLLVDDLPIADLVQSTDTPGLDVLPADTSLAGVEQVLANRIGRETILREAFDAFEEAVTKAATDQGPLAGYDYLLMDCPPSLGVLSANALVAADRVLVPMQAEYLSLQGMAKLMEVVQLVQKRLNPALELACILPCMLDTRTNLGAEVLGEIQNHFPDELADSSIRVNVKLAESPSFGRTIFEHAPDSNGARDYAAFATEYLGRFSGEDARAEDVEVWRASIEEPEDNTDSLPKDEFETDATDDETSEPTLAPSRTADNGTYGSMDNAVEEAPAQVNEEVVADVSQSNVGQEVFAQASEPEVTTSPANANHEPSSGSMHATAPPKTVHPKPADVAPPTRETDASSAAKMASAASALPVAWQRPARAIFPPKSPTPDAPARSRENEA